MSLHPSSPFYTEEEIQDWIKQKESLRMSDFDSPDGYRRAIAEIEHEIETACRLGPVIPPA